MATTQPTPSGFDRRWTLGTSGRVLAALVTVVCVQLLLGLDARAHPDDGANIGAGLATLLVFAAAPALWAGWDGWHLRRLLPVVVRWLIVSVVFACSWAVSNAVGSQSSLDLVGDGLWLLGLTLATSATGLLIARGASRATTAHRA